MLVKLFFAVMALGVMLAHAATEPEAKCWNPTWKSYANVGEFTKEFLSKFDKTNTGVTGGDAKDSAQAFVCASAIFKWLKTFGTDVYKLDVTNESSGVTRVFGVDIGKNQERQGEIVNGKGYFIWRQGGVCKMTRFRNNSSVFFNENIQIRDDGLYGGPKRSSYKLASCTIQEIDNELCDNQYLTDVQEAYVFGKWVHQMKTCGTTHAQ